MSAETKQELIIVELYVYDHEQHEIEFWNWLAEAFENAFEEEK